MWRPYALKERYYQKYSIKYIYSTSQMLKLSLILHTFSVTGLVASLFLMYRSLVLKQLDGRVKHFKSLKNHKRTE